MSPVSSSLPHSAHAANATAIPDARSASLSPTGRHAALLLGPAIRSANQVFPGGTGGVTELEPHWAAAIEAATD